MSSNTATEDLALVNQRFYDALWSYSRLVRPERFNTWPLLSELASRSPSRLEVGPGLRPRSPIAGTRFIDISPPVVARLNAEGGVASEGAIAFLPFADGSFDLVCVFDVIEHIADDQARVPGDKPRAQEGRAPCAFGAHLRGALDGFRHAGRACEAVRAS